LVAWAGSFGSLEQVGLEGTGSYGAGLARWLRQRDVTVIEVERPNRQTRRRRGTSDPIDAEAAARAVLAGTATGQPKAGDGPVEMIRALQVARRSAVRARTQAVNQFHALVVTAPEPLREQLRPLSLRKRVATAAAFRPGATLSTPTAATKLALRCLARCYQQLSAEIEALDAHLTRLVAHVAPALLAVKGVGTDTAAVLLAAAGDNPDRLRSEAAFAHCQLAAVSAPVVFGQDAPRLRSQDAPAVCGQDAPPATGLKQRHSIVSTFRRFDAVGSGQRPVAGGVAGASRGVPSFPSTRSWRPARR
jgi:transposase